MTSPTSKKGKTEALATNDAVASSGASANGASANSAGSERPATEASQSRVLVVDDVAANVRLLSGILKVEGFDICTAASGRRLWSELPTGART